MKDVTGVYSTLCSNWKRVTISFWILLTIYFGVNIFGGLETSDIIKYKPLPPLFQKFAAIFPPNGSIPLIHRERKIDECSHLFQNISFTGQGENMRLFNIHGCELKNYTTRETFKSCFNTGDRIAFIGDSRVRQWFSYFKASWNNTKVNDRNFKFDVVEALNGLTIEFRWCPHVNDMIGILKDWLNGTKPRPTHIFAGAGIWHIRDSNADVKEEVNYENYLNTTLKYLLELKRHSHVAWLPQDPVDERLNEYFTNMAVNSIICKYNDIAKRVLENNGIPMLWSAYLTAQQLPNSYRNRVHLFFIVDKYKTRILLNWQCSLRSQLDMCTEACRHNNRTIT